MNPTMAAIRDKDDAHPLGVVGWRSEYHAMRAALDAVLGAHRHRVADNGTVDWCDECQDGPWPCKTVRAIAAHLDIEEQR